MSNMLLIYYLKKMFLEIYELKYYLRHILS